MEYAVVSSSQLRGRAMYNLCSDFLQGRGHLLIGSYDMDYLLYEDLDFLVFDYKYYLDYKNKIKNPRLKGKNLVLISFERDLRGLERVPDYIRVLGADSPLEALEEAFFLEEKNQNSWVLEERDKSILFLLAQGLTNKEIGKKLYLSEKTIKNNLSRIYKALGVKNRFEAIEAFKNKKIIYKQKG